RLDAVAVIGNLTAAAQTSAGFATAFPCGAPLPLAASLNWNGRPAVANGSIVKLGFGGEPCVFSSQPTHLVYDVTGFITDEDFYTPLTPVRLSDSREGWRARCPFVPIALPPSFGVRPVIVLYQGDGDVSDDPTLPTDGMIFGSIQTNGNCTLLLASAPDAQGDRVIQVSDGSVIGHLPPALEALDDDLLVRVEEIELERVGGERVVAFAVGTIDGELVGVTQPVRVPIPGLFFDVQMLTELSSRGNQMGIAVHSGGAASVAVASTSGVSMSRFEAGALDRLTGLDLSPNGFWVVLTGELRVVRNDPLRQDGAVGPPPMCTANVVRVFSYAGVLLHEEISCEGVGQSAMFVGRGELFICGPDRTQRLELFGSLETIEIFDDQHWAAFAPSCGRQIR
ncbi:MAG: hypothetical protein AAGG08_07985, partial [Actinomycetota bacterium]